MKRLASILVLLGGLQSLALGFGETAPAVKPAAAKPAALDHTAVVYVIPVRDEIAKPVLYILRRGLKEAIERKADAVVLDMETPGGALDVTFQIMEALGNFSGEKITFVDKEALSAGAFISAATDEIYFAPDGVIGAAAPVLSTGGEIDTTMKQKIVSYLRAKVRAESEGKGYRGQVISAMIDADLELKIGDKVIKPKGELLSLTASEANATYGEPPRKLLGAGVAKNVEELLDAKFGHGRYEIRRLEVSWSEKLAQLLAAVGPVLMGLGLLALFIEFKTPGFGVFGVSGILLLLLVFFGHYVAGLSGHEPAILFAVGLLLLAIELVFFPGLVLPAVAGVACMILSLVWAGADLWPNQPVSFSGDVFLGPALNVGLALVIAVVLFAALLKYLPKSWFWDRLVLHAAVSANAQADAVRVDSVRDALVGAEGVAVTGLFPSGEVEIGGRRYQARLDIGHVTPGTPVVVTGRADFVLLVERKAT